MGVPLQGFPCRTAFRAPWGARRCPGRPRGTIPVAPLLFSEHLHKAAVAPVVGDAPAAAVPRRLAPGRVDHHLPPGLVPVASVGEQMAPLTHLRAFAARVAAEVDGIVPAGRDADGVGIAVRPLVHAHFPPIAQQPLGGHVAVGVLKLLPIAPRRVPVAVLLLLLPVVAIGGLWGGLGERLQLSRLLIHHVEGLVRSGEVLTPLVRHPVRAAPQVQLPIDCVRA
mmetsp:Transcript_117000/g.331095  ORF Transcript_117000/g.331095 Transcript_117000/m.331095 type:complete len:224 (-) Transcript_117000:513-1184(-)